MIAKSLHATRCRPPWFPLCVLIGVVIAGAWARVANLGAEPFWTDELNHHFAAQSLSEGRGPILPSGESYERGLIITRAVALMQHRIADPELAARLPSAVFGMISLVLMASVSWRIAGPWAAVWGTLLLAIHPESLFQARNARFYTLQACLGLVALFGLWRATLPVPSIPDGGQSRRERWGWFAVAALSFAAAAAVQLTTLVAVVGAGAWAAGVAAARLRIGGATALRHDPATQVALLGVVAGVLVLVAGVANPGARELWSVAFAPPLHTREAGRWVYYQTLAADLPFILAVLPGAVLLALAVQPRRALFLASLSLVPLALHVAVLPWRHARYALLAFPPLFLLVGVAAAVAATRLREAITFALARSGVPAARRVSAAAVAAAAAWAVVTLPAFGPFQSLLRRPPSASNDWTVTAELLRALPDADALPLGSLDPLMSLHFTHRVDFGVQLGLLDFAVDSSGRHPVPRHPPVLGGRPHDFYTGVPIITSPEEIRRAYARYGSVLIVADRMREVLIDPALAGVLVRDAEDLCGDRCKRVRLYRWRFGTSAGTPATAPVTGVELDRVVVVAP